MNTSQNAFLSDGIDSLFGDTGNPNEYEIMVNVDDIDVEIQIRDEFEDDENRLTELGHSLRKRQLHAIVIRPNRDGRKKPYLLVAGERRHRAAILEGLPQLRARVMDMDDEEAEDMQHAENIHRKNLTQIEEAKKIQRDLDRLGDVQTVLEKYHKSHAWLSKTLSLLNLPEQAKRLVIENVSADIEIINAVKTIEKLDPVKAKELVDDLKVTRGKSNARAKVAKIKEEVKPSKKTNESSKQNTENEEQGSNVIIFSDAKTITSLEEVLSKVYMEIYNLGLNPKTVLKTMNNADKESIEIWLRSFYDLGKQDANTTRGVVHGFRSHRFSGSGMGALALVAYLHGADNGDKFSVLNILSDVTP
jgi:ParB family chromosome partitioning protein